MFSQKINSQLKMQLELDDLGSKLTERYSNGVLNLSGFFKGESYVIDAQDLSHFVRLFTSSLDCTTLAFKEIHTIDLSHLLLVENDYEVGDGEAYFVYIRLKAVCDLITANTQISTLILNDTNISKSDALLICDAVQKNHQITTLELNGNKLPLEILDKIDLVLTRNRMDLEEKINSSLRLQRKN